VSKENTFETGLFLNSSDTVDDVEEFFVPAQFFVVVNNWTEIDVRRVSCLEKLLQELNSFIIGLVPFSSIALIFSGIKLILTLILFSGT
jgi:hypothetical protein